MYGTLSRLIFLIVASVLAACSHTGESQRSAVEGVLDLRGWDSATDGPAALKGAWQFYWEQLLVPETFAGDSALPGATLVLPGAWNDSRHGRTYPAEGHATLRLRIRTDAPAGTVRGLYIPNMLSAYRIWVDGHELLQAGRVGTDVASNQAGWDNRTVTFMQSGPDIEVLIQVANYYHRDGGVRANLLLGGEQQIHGYWLRQVSRDMFLFGGLVLMGLYQLAVFLLRRKDKAYFFFAVFCLAGAYYSAAAGQTVVTAFFPEVPGIWVSGSHAISVYILITSFTFYLVRLYPAESFPIMVRILAMLALLFVVATVVLPGQYISRLLHSFEVIVVVYLVYALVVLIRAVRRSRDGASLALTGLLILGVSAVHDILFDFNLVRFQNLTAFGILAFVLTQAFVLSLRYTYAFARIETLEQSLRRADRLKDDFLANTSHELRTPMNGMIGLAESLLNSAQELSAGARRSLELIALSGRRLMGLVENTLDLTRLKHGDLHCELAPVALEPTARLVLEMCRPLVGDKPLTLREKVAGGLPPVLADEGRLQQILFNLMGNAIRFTDQGEVELGAERAGERVRVWVRDTGPGIPPEARERIFEPYEQAEPGGTAGRGGTGLGLAIARHLVALHGGALELESDSGKGSVFDFFLPVAADALDADAAMHAAPPVILGDIEEDLPRGGNGAQEEPQPSDTTQARVSRILVVDDDPINLSVLNSQLTPEDYLVTSAHSGAAALREIEKQAPDLVILDVMMPGMSGYEVCRRIREQYDAAALPVLMLTARTRMEDVVRGLDSGANDYLAKPFHREELLARVRSQLLVKENDGLRWEVARYEEALETLKKSQHTEEPGDILRPLLVKLLQTALQCWELGGGKSKLALAEESGIWSVTLDGSSYKTRTLDRYLDIKSLPRRPRWRNVVHTVRFVLERCPDCPLSDDLQSQLARFDELVHHHSFG